MDSLLTPAQVAERLAIKPRTLFKWISTGTFPPAPVRVSRKAVRWPESVVADWISKQNPSAAGAA